MPYRNLFIENPAHISVKSNRLMIRTDTERSVPLEDIVSIMIESRQSTITAAALSLLGQRGCCVFLCDEKHMPCAVLTPFQQYSRTFSVQQSQMGLGEVKRKHMWQQIVKSKILNQARCLKFSCHEKDVPTVSCLSEKVRSGDAGNTEAVAARRYFPMLFGNDFTRGEDNITNAALNYGYAILRGCTARSIAVHGLNPCFGIQHSSELNGFNLADDLMEPYRPVIDLIVASVLEKTTEMTAMIKACLYNALNLDIIINNTHQSLSNAVDMTVISYVRSLTSSAEQLWLPELCGIEQHRYE